MGAYAATTGVRRTVTVSEGTNLSATEDLPDRKTIVVDLQETFVVAAHEWGHGQGASPIRYWNRRARTGRPRAMPSLFSPSKAGRFTSG